MKLAPLALKKHESKNKFLNMVETIEIQIYLSTIFIIKSSKLIYECYLNSGTGKACAGHNIVKLLLFITLKPLELSIEGNFGETRPTGSRDKT